MKSKIGIIVEVSSEKRCLGKSGENFEQRWLNEPDGHVTHCIVLSKGCADDNIVGLKFWIDAEKGDKKENRFYFGWDQILEVRTLDGHPIYRNWYLCPNCRRITKSFPKGIGPYCEHCNCKISAEENRKACISPFP